MQLFILALLLFTLGRNANLKELEPILESIGGEEAASAFKRAEELSSMFGAIQSFAATSNTPSPQNFEGTEKNEAAKNPDVGGCVDTYTRPLAPVAGIADDKITACLSRYIALGE